MGTAKNAEGAKNAKSAEVWHDDFTADEFRDLSALSNSTQSVPANRT